MRGMGLHMGLSRSNRFNPAVLFGSSTAGAYYEISPSTTFTDTTRTTPAQVGQAVAAVTDQSGRGNHLTQATAASRPILRQDSGGRYYLEFDGVDDFLRATFAISQPWDRISAIRQTSWTSGRIIYHGVTAARGALYNSGTTPTLALFNGAAACQNSDAAVGANVVVTERFNDASSRLGVNNGAYATGDSGDINPPGGITIGASEATTNFGHFRLYSLLMIGRALSDAETVMARQSIARSAGVVL